MCSPCFNSVSAIYIPVGLPDVQGVGVCDASLVCLLLQEVEEVFDSKRGAAWRDAEDGLKQVVQEFLQRSLEREHREIKHGAKTVFDQTQKSLPELISRAFGPHLK